MAGAIFGALVIQRLGSRVTMLGMSALAIVSALAMAAMPMELDDTTRLIVLFAITGGLLNAVQTTMYALAAHVYPTEIRGTGVGTAVGVWPHRQRAGVLCRQLRAGSRRPARLFLVVGGH